MPCTVVLFSATYNYRFECHALSFVLVPCAGIVFSAMSRNSFYRVNGRRNDETSRLEVDNKRTPARGSSVVVVCLFCFFVFFDGMYERQLVPPLAFSCALSMSFCDVQNNST